MAPWHRAKGIGCVGAEAAGESAEVFRVMNHEYVGNKNLTEDRAEGYVNTGNRKKIKAKIIEYVNILGIEVY